MAETVTIHAAKTHLSRLIARVEAGEEVVIARGTVPVAKLVPVAPVSPRPGFGFLRHEMAVGDEALDDWTEEELQEWEEGHPSDPLHRP